MRSLRLRRRGVFLAVLSLAFGASACSDGAQTTSATSAASAASSDSATSATTADSSVPVNTTIASVDTTPRTVASPPSTPAAPTTRTLRVPADFATIQAAVDDARPGDLVLIAPGTYGEAVHVRVSSIVLRGEERNTVILDGGDALENGILVAANNVAVENLTVRRFTVNGLLFTKAYDDEVDDPTNHVLLQGYRASYVTASNNGLYGIYAFFARGGVIEHSYASGHSDSGFYVGQCKPCDAVLRNNIGELNAVGYEGTNASGNLYVINSIWRRNRVGVTPNSQDMERLAPQGDTVIAGNTVEDNQDPGAPSAAQGGTGLGIAVGGGERNRVFRNRVQRNVNAGIVVTDLAGYQPNANEVRENVLADNGVDLALYSSDGAASVPTRGNCFAGNSFTASFPASIETAASCGADRAGAADGSITGGPLSLQPGAPNVDYRLVPLPPPQPSMPGAQSNDRSPASGVPPIVDVTTIVVPA